MFPENVLFDFVRLHLEEEMVGCVPPHAEPLPYDRWLARSCLQKAIRRGETETAHRALATLLEQDRYGIWRHLMVIALEDVGVADLDTVARVVAAGRNRAWRKARGGEWAVASFLVQRMAEGLHCQAACDLMLVATNLPALDGFRVEALDADHAELIRLFGRTAERPEKRGVVALAIGGGLAEKQAHHDPEAVFGILAEQRYSPRVVEICRAAWTSTRNPMALLLPVVWQQWMSNDVLAVQGDLMPLTPSSGKVPWYAIDQFTRLGGQVARAYLARDGQMRSILDHAGIGRLQQPRTLGDLLFLIEGGLVERRAIWPTGDRLRLPVRALPGAIKLGSSLGDALAQLLSKADLIAKLRAHHLYPSQG
jgi:hypothetical protein